IKSHKNRQSLPLFPLSFPPLDSPFLIPFFPLLCRFFPAKEGEKGDQEGGVQRGKTKGKKGEGMPIFVGFYSSLPLFPLGFPPLAYGELESGNSQKTNWRHK
ncbi:MAG: hypothetical protein J6M07_06310, partial [Ruminococcus sp.]|nr:hypothetical protein [Ruminococcus sp.]